MNKRVLTAFIFFLLILAFSRPALAEDLYLSHTLEDYTEGADTATLNFTLHLENLGVTALNNIVLSYVPIMVITIDEVTVNVATIEADQALDIPVTIVIPLPFEQRIFEQEPLFWTGEYDNPDVSGVIVEFPARSHMGGAL